MKGVYDSEVIAQSEVAPGVYRTLLKGREIANESKPGQFVNVQVSRTTDPLLRRPFSVYAVYPSEGLYALLYVMVGRGTRLLHKVQPGEKISVVGPLGRSFDLGDLPDDEHVVVAGGCGAAPLHFLCEVLCNKWGCESVTVLAGARDKSAVLCEAEFRSHGVQVGITTEDGSYGERGLVTELLQQYLADRVDASAASDRSNRGGVGASAASDRSNGGGVDASAASDRSNGGGVDASAACYRSKVRVYSCGPHAMAREVAKISARYGVHCQVSLENNMACGFGVCMGCVQKIRGAGPGDTSGRDWHHERVCADGPVFNAEDVIWE